MFGTVIVSTARSSLGRDANGCADSPEGKDDVSTDLQISTEDGATGGAATRLDLCLAGERPNSYIAVVQMGENVAQVHRMSRRDRGVPYDRALDRHEVAQLARVTPRAVRHRVDALWRRMGCGHGPRAAEPRRR